MLDRDECEKHSTVPRILEEIQKMYKKIDDYHPIIPLKEDDYKPQLMIKSKKPNKNDKYKHFIHHQSFQDVVHDAFKNSIIKSEIYEIVKNDGET